MQGSASISRQDAPAVVPVRIDSSTRRRLIAGVVAAPCGIVLGLAAWLTPATDGHGTHQQLNLPECGWITMADIPCPSCGMTTAFAHAANGDLLSSVLTQPMGALLAVLTAMTLLASVFIAITGSNVARVFGQFLGRRAIWYSVAFAAAAWGYKILSHRGII